MSTATLQILRSPKFTRPEPAAVVRAKSGWNGKGECSISSIEKDFTIEQPEIPSWSYRLTAEGINATLKSIEKLAEVAAEDEDDGYPGAPTEYALAASLRTIKHAGALLDTDVPAGSPFADVGGGIRITWEKRSREVLLVIPGTPNGRGYLYRYWGSGSDVSDTLSSDGLATLLTWLTQE